MSTDIESSARRTTNERRAVGALLARRITTKQLVAEVGQVPQLRDRRLQAIALVACCAELLNIPFDARRFADTVRGLGHQGPIEHELEELMREGAAHA